MLRRQFKIGFYLHLTIQAYLLCHVASCKKCISTTMQYSMLAINATMNIRGQLDFTNLLLLGVSNETLLNIVKMIDPQEVT